MKTERLVLLVTLKDKTALTERANALGISVSELVRQAAADYDPDEAAARAEVEAYMPEFNATVDSLHQSFERMIAKLGATEQRLAEMDTPEYRARVRQTLLDDPTIDWDAARRAFGRREHAA